MRDRLIREAFGAASRTLQRDVTLTTLELNLRYAVRDGLLPMAAVDDVARLTSDDRRELATRLAKGTPFTELKSEFFENGDGRRKTARGRAAAIRGALHTLVTEADGRPDGFGLRAYELPVARTAVELLTGWLNVPRPDVTLTDVVSGLAADRRDCSPLGTAHAGRGGRGATEGSI